MCRRLTFLTVCSLFIIGIALPATAADLAIKLAPSSSGPVAQGTPFRFVAKIENRGDVTVRVGVTFTLARGGDEVPFDLEAVTVEPGAIKRVPVSVVASRWFGGLGGFTIIATADGMAPAELGFEVGKASVTTPRFEDVTSTMGMDVQDPGDGSCGHWASGAAWADVDGDGDNDAYVPHEWGEANLWIDTGSSFVDRATSAGVTNEGSRGIGAVFADYDGDGDPDLYVTNDGPNRLYQNDGSGHFTDVAVGAGVADGRASTSASWADYDGDGDLDLYVTNYVRCLTEGVGGFDYHRDGLYRNEGDGTFTDQTALLERTGGTDGAGFQAAWFDYDGDGDQDLYLGNDYTGPRPKANVLWRNDGPAADGSWIFTNVSQASGAGIGINTMGIAVADYDHDMDLDVALSNIDSTVLLQNQGDGTFVNVAGKAHVGRPRSSLTDRAVTWGLTFADFNNDGWEDLYVPGGSLRYAGAFEAQPNALFVNAMDGTFYDLSAASGVADPGRSRGVALADIDGDGRIDIYVKNQSGMPSLYRNITRRADAHWLGLDLVGTTSNADGCGATVRATLAGGDVLFRELFCGSVSQASGSEAVLHLGLGAARSVVRLTVSWPSGTVQKLRNVKADSVIAVTEPAA